MSRPSERMERLARRSMIVLVGGWILATPFARAEMVEDIVAWVNGEIITQSDYQEEEELVIAEASRRFTGDELATQVEQIRQGLLLQMIDRKILVDHARRLFQDMGKVRDSLYDNFKQQQGITSDAELERLLAQEGMTVAELKDRLIEMYAPTEVIEMEIRSRIGVSNKELDGFYEENLDQFKIPAEVRLREIVILAADEERKRVRRPEAEEVIERLATGEDFEELAAEVSESGSKDSGGLVGTMKRADLAQPIAEAAFSLPVGAVSGVIETGHGLHVIRVESRTEDRVKPLAEVREQLRSFLEQRKSVEEMSAFMEKARADAEWCVKPRYQALLSVPLPGPCEAL